MEKNREGDEETKRNNQDEKELRCKYRRRKSKGKEIMAMES